MKLRCQLKGIKCPRYKHHGIFNPDNKTITRLLPGFEPVCWVYSACFTEVSRDAGGFAANRCDGAYRKRA